MLAGMTSREFTEWLLFDAVYGLTDKQDDYRAGTIASIVFNTRQGRKAGSKRVTPQDFFQSLRPQKAAEQSGPEALKEKWEAIAASLGAKVPGLTDVDDREPGGDPRP